jgi:hypothetical protein
LSTERKFVVVLDRDMSVTYAYSVSDSTTGEGVDMSEESDFLDLLQLQENLDMISKLELLDWAKDHGLSLTDRKLTSLMAEGLLPKTARIGSRGGAFPKIAERQLWFVLKSRERGLSVAAVRELIPVWRYLLRAVRNREMVVGELERIASEHLTMTEAVYALPSVVSSALPCPHCRAEELSAIKFIMKDGTVASRDNGDKVTIGFANTATDCDVKDFTRLAIPDADEENDPSTVVLHVPPQELKAVENAEEPSLRQLQPESDDSQSPRPLVLYSESPSKRPRQNNKVLSPRGATE